jgi:AraC family transcriptional regulator of adaptative response/methylated-DNA-[protein]-cysteine methyltransferase
MGRFTLSTQTVRRSNIMLTMATHYKASSDFDAPDDAERWAAVQRRDPKADGTFFYSVLTTGVYCRPSCASRPARRENVAFHATASAAEQAGYRPCRRCRPNEPALAEKRAQLVAQACRLIESADQAPALDALAEAAGLSRFHFHRIFRSVTGITPKAYADAHRRRLLGRQIARSPTVTEAIYGAGFNSSGRFYASAPELLGMSAGTLRAGGAGAVIRFAVGECSLGAILVAATDLGVCAIEFGDEPEALVNGLQDRFPKARLVGADSEFEQLVARVVGFVEEPARGLQLPLDVRGTAFQQRVWQALRDIPAGTTTSYTELARRIGAPAAVRAVAGACAANKIAVAIPCHRVVRSDGGISGYRWGVERKRALLAREAA